MKKLLIGLSALAALSACDGAHGPHTTANAFALADANNNGVLEFSEYTSLVQAKELDRATTSTQANSADLSRDKLRTRFDALDANDNHVLSRTELGVK